MKNMNYQEVLAITNERLANGGIFLSVGGQTPNTMTIGWATIGHIWKMPVFMALVRPQRYTFGILKKTGNFTISVPTRLPLKAELAFAGTKSGRDVNKFDGHGLTMAKSQCVEAPIIAECGLHFECKVRLIQNMTGDQMDPEIIRMAYPDGDFHTMFFGEILACYSTDN